MSGATRQDVFKLMGYIQDDLRAIQAKLVEVRSMMASMPMREEAPVFRCPKCGVSCSGERSLGFHLQNVYDGPIVAWNDAGTVAPGPDPGPLGGSVKVTHYLEPKKL